jgi:spore maturation protein CgeB
VRVLTVEPGPAFSVADVHRGWVRGLVAAGAEVVSLNLGDRLDFYSQALLKKGDAEPQRAFNSEAAIAMAAKGIEVAAFECWPDVVLIVSGFFVPAFTLDLLRQRGMKTVMLHTESPYEDDGQLKRAPRVDINLLNDPTNLERFREVNPNTWYQPHAYDPEVHHPRSPKPKLECDFAFVGTGYPSRIEFFEACDFSGLDVLFAGNWTRARDTGLEKYVAHDLEECVSNDQAVDIYSSAKVNANLYRIESERPELAEGWAMGPREVELAACGAFMLRQQRGENDEVLGFLPTFSTPEELTDQIRYWLPRDAERKELAGRAREAVADRTFENHAKQLLRRLEAL